MHNQTQARGVRRAHLPMDRSLEGILVRGVRTVLGVAAGMVLVRAITGVLASHTISTRPAASAHGHVGRRARDEQRGATVIPCDRRDVSGLVT